MRPVWAILIFMWMGVFWSHKGVTQARILLKAGFAVTPLDSMRTANRDPKYAQPVPHTAHLNMPRATLGDCVCILRFTDPGSRVG